MDKDKDGQVLMVDKRSFLKLLNKTSFQCLINKVKIKRKLTMEMSALLETYSLPSTADLFLLNSIGSGQFGEVFLFATEEEEEEGKVTNELLCVKSIAKTWDDGEKQLRIIVERERNIMSMIEHPFFQ